MNTQNFIKILIAEDNKVSRDMMAGILKTQGYEIVPASDGDEAIDLIMEDRVDLALVDINMAPKGGFEFVKYLVTKGIKIPVVIVTADNSSDVLMQASALGVMKVIQKPVQPERLLKTVEHILKRSGLNPNPMGVESFETKLNDEDLMTRVIEMAQKNVQSGSGGPFAAIVTNADGEILGRGVHGKSSRADPTAHAEVMAIRQASEKLGQTDLSDCRLFCVSEPTMMGKALIVSVGIPKVYYALTHADINKNKPPATQGNPDYSQLCQEKAQSILGKA